MTGIHALLQVLYVQIWLGPLLLMRKPFLLASLANSQRNTAKQFSFQTTWVTIYINIQSLSDITGEIALLCLCLLQ